MNSLLAARINDEELMTVVSRACGELTTHHLNSLMGRIEWCQQQRSKVHTDTELEAWCAEEDGLTDALLDNDRTSYFQHRSSAIFERYRLGLEDGRALIRAARVDRWLQLSGS